MAQGTWIDVGAAEELLHEGARDLVGRAVELAAALVAGSLESRRPARGGRKAHELDSRAQLPAAE